MSKARIDDLTLARMISATDGVKEVTFETYMVDEASNIIGVRVYDDDGVPCNKVNEDAGNVIAAAVAVEVLLGKTLPIGTKFHLKIDFGFEE